MALVTQADIEEFTGFSEIDFKYGGVQMTESQWATFCATIIGNVTQIINRYCNVVSFELHTATEFHNGRGGTMDEYSAWSPTYQETDRAYYLREQPVILVTKVEEDTAGITNIATWVTRTLRSATVAGDYYPIIRDGLTYVRFHNNVPVAGINNVRITYTSGYVEGSNELKEIKFVALKMCANALLVKKKIQEAMTIRQMGTRDYSHMFETLNEGQILTEDNRLLLSKYRRVRLGYEMYV